MTIMRLALLLTLLLCVSGPALAGDPLDTNNDGVISPEEFAAAMQSFGGSGDTGGTTGGLDADGDGLITIEEFRAAYPDYAGNPDQNHDGYVDNSELDALQAPSLQTPTLKP